MTFSLMYLVAGVVILVLLWFFFEESMNESIKK
jgi:hypothetical protein